MANGEFASQGEIMLDLTKPVQRRDGTPARIICTDLKSNLPAFTVMALVGHNGREIAVRFQADGIVAAHGRPSALDLINAPEKLPTRWLNFYKHLDGTVTNISLPTKEKADTIHYVGLTRIACIEVNGNVGDGIAATQPEADEDEEE